MIRLTTSYFSEPIEFLENKINLLVIENTIIFTKIIREILEQINGQEGKFILSENYNILEFHKNIEIITDVFNLDFNNKKIINKIYTNLKEISNLDMMKESQELLFNIYSYLESLIENTDYPLTYKCDIDITNIFKICNVSIEIDAENILEKILNYIILCRDIFGIKLFIFINLRSILSQEQFLDLYKMIGYEKINILLLENNINYVIKSYEKVRILDKDLCEVY